MLTRVNKWSSGKGLGLNCHVFELVQISPRQFANILAQIIEKYWLRSIIYKTRVIPNNVCIVISTQFNLNCIFRIDLIHLQQKSLQEYVNTITCTRILNLNSVRQVTRKQ